MLYWLNGSVAPMWLYLFLASGTGFPAGRKVDVPANFLFAPSDLTPPAPQSWLARMYGNITHYEVAPRGGHFPGMDNPDRLIASLRRVFGAGRGA
jgi:pimeloyl-ACP methyl ester carboxylesterase